MNELIYAVFSTWSLVVLSGAPIAIVAVAIGVLIRSLLSSRPSSKSEWLPAIVIGLSSLVWIFLYAEMLSDKRVPVLDYGAPLLFFVALFALPALCIAMWRKRCSLSTTPRHRRLLIFANCLALLTLAPGVLMIIFYATASF